MQSIKESVVHQNGGSKTVLLISSRFHKKSIVSMLIITVMLGVSGCASDNGPVGVTGGVTGGNKDASSTYIPETENKLSSNELVSAAVRTGNASMASKDYSTAVGFYRRAFNTKPTAENLIHWTKSLRLSGQAQEAVLILQEQIQRRFSGNVEVLTELGRASLDGGYIPEARVALDKAIALPGASWDTYMTRGALYARESNPTAAQSMFTTARQLAKTTYEQDGADANLALLQAQNGQVQQAISQLEPLAHRPGVNPKILSTLGIIYGMTGAMQQYQVYTAASGMSADDIQQGAAWLNDSSASRANSQIDVAPAKSRGRR